MTRAFVTGDKRLDLGSVACMLWYGLGSACGKLAFVLEAGVLDGGGKELRGRNCCRAEQRKLALS